MLLSSVGLPEASDMRAPEASRRVNGAEERDGGTWWPVSPRAELEAG